MLVLIANHYIEPTEVAAVCRAQIGEVRGVWVHMKRNDAPLLLEGDELDPDAIAAQINTEVGKADEADQARRASRMTEMADRLVAATVKILGQPPGGVELTPEQVDSIVGMGLAGDDDEQPRRAA